jgi:hypothetical protein
VPVATGESISTAHGLVLSTTPRDDASVNETIPAQGFRAAFADLASRTDGVQARSTGKMIEYPLPTAQLAQGGPDPRMPALLVLTLVLGVLAASAPCSSGPHGGVEPTDAHPDDAARQQQKRSRP